MQLQGAESATTSGASPSAVYFEQISALVDKQIPEQAKSLADNATNLEKVAQYCEDIYVNSKDADKQHLLNETKGYTTQALASVAYQIHVLANSFLLLLDNQTEILNNMNVSVAHFAHEVNIHKEKVARREIGILTTNKNVTRTVKVKKPEIEEKPVKYVRRPVDYAILDDVGHGVKLTRHSDPLSKLGVQTVGRQNSYSSTHSSSNQPGNTTSSSQLDGVPIGQHTPPMLLKSGGAGGTVRSAASLMQQQQQQLQHQQSTVSTGSGGGIYRAPVAPPSVPSEYLSRQELGIYSSKKELNQSLASAGGDTSIGGAYGGMSYRRPSQSSTNNMSLNMGGGEYSDTMDRRMAATYMQQFGVYNPGVNPAAHLMASNNGNSSVGYASGKDLGLIRTNLNNIDYATNGTIYRRPQLSSMIYEQRQNSTATGIPQPPQPPSQQQSNTSLYGPGRMSSGGGGGGGLPPPPPPPMPASLLSQQSAYEASPPQPPPPPPPALPQAPPPNSGGFLASSHEFDDVDADLIDDDDDHEVIPNWVPINRCLEKVITTFDYEGQRDDELSFKENMFIYVIKKNDDHWYEGIMKNQMGNVISGLYPYNYARTVKRYVDDPRITQC